MNVITEQVKSLYEHVRVCEINKGVYILVFPGLLHNLHPPRGDGSFLPLSNLLKGFYCDLKIIALFHKSEIVGYSHIKPNRATRADGIFSDFHLENRAYGLAGVDCYPVFIGSVHTRRSCIIHLSRINITSDLISKTVKIIIGKYQNPPIYAWIGPGIGKDNFKIKEEVASELISKGLDEFVIFDKGKEQNFFDLEKAIKDRVAKEVSAFGSELEIQNFLDNGEKVDTADTNNPYSSHFLQMRKLQVPSGNIFIVLETSV